MMDPLSVAASVAGLLKGAQELSGILGPYISATKEPPAIAYRVHSEISNTKIVLSAVQTLTQNLNSVNARNASLIQIDQIVAILTDGVLIFSELEIACGSLKDQQPSTLRLRSRLNFVRKESGLSSLLMRLQAFKDSLSLILTILQCDSDFRAAQHQARLSTNVQTLLENNEDLSRRLMNLEDAFDVQTIVSKRRSHVGSLFSPSNPRDSAVISTIQGNPSTSDISRPSLTLDSSSVTSSEFQSDLESSRVYRRAQRDTMDYSFRSSIAGSNTWSVFSGLSLGDVSIMSVIALPVYRFDISNPQHYDFGNESQAQEPTATQPFQEEQEHQKSVFHSSLELKLLLTQIDGFPDLIEKAKPTNPFENPNPLEQLRAVFRQGFPLLMIFNQLEPRWSINSFIGYEKQSAAEFIQACNTILQLDVDDIFTMSDLMGDSLFQFSKVSSVLHRVVTEIPWIHPVDPALLAPPDNHDVSPLFKSVLADFLTQERIFFAKLEKIAAAKARLERNDLIPGVMITELFGPLHTVLDPQIELLLELEKMSFAPISEQLWGNPFLDWFSTACTWYVPFVSQERRKRDILAIWIQKTATFNPGATELLKECDNFLHCPQIRLTEYLQFVQTAADMVPNPTNGSLAATQIKHLLATIESANEEQQLDSVLDDLKNRVDDWKGHRPNQFGRLVLFENTPVQVRDRIRNYNVYVFEKVIFICQELLPSRGARDLLFRRSKLPETSAPLKLVIKGRVFISNIRNVQSSTENNSFDCTVEYAGEAMESFTLKFATMAVLQKWEEKLKELQR